MGLDVSYGAFSGGYISFRAFREKVEEALGETLLSDGMREFLQHSDCEGYMTVDDVRECADQMETLLPFLDAAGVGGGHIARDGGYGQVARRWIAASRDAVANGDGLEFH